MLCPVWEAAAGGVGKWRSQRCKPMECARKMGRKKAFGHHIPRSPCSRAISSGVWPGRAAAGASTSPCSGRVSAEPKEEGEPQQGWQWLEELGMSPACKRQLERMGVSSSPAAVGRERGKIEQSHQQRRLFWEQRGICSCSHKFGTALEPKTSIPAQAREGLGAPSRAQRSRSGSPFPGLPQTRRV